MGAIEQTLDALDDRVGGACQAVAICGRNKALIQRLQSRCVAVCCQSVRGFLSGGCWHFCGTATADEACIAQGVPWRPESQIVWLCHQHGRVDDGMRCHHHQSRSGHHRRSAHLRLAHHPEWFHTLPGVWMHDALQKCSGAVGVDH